MPDLPHGLFPESEINSLIPYVTDLEFEVDRLRKQGRFIENQTWSTIQRIRTLCHSVHRPSANDDVFHEINSQLEMLGNVLVDLHQHPGYHPAHDQVCAIAVRPVIEQVFRWQQRLEGAIQIKLILELDIEYVDWFPARLRHIIDNLLTNAIQSGVHGQGESRITINLRRSAQGYELKVIDNTISQFTEARLEMLHLSRRASPGRPASLCVGLAVVKSLIHQSGGTLTVQFDDRLGTCFLAVLPRFDMDDYLENQPNASEPAADTMANLARAGG